MAMTSSTVRMRQCSVCGVDIAPERLARHPHTIVCGPQCKRKRDSRRIAESQKQIRRDARKWRALQIQQSATKAADTKLTD